MVANSPKQVIIECISQPLGECDLNPSQVPDVQRDIPQARVCQGGGLGARPSTIQFLQERHLSDRQLLIQNLHCHLRVPNDIYN